MTITVRVTHPTSINTSGVFHAPRNRATAIAVTTISKPLRISEQAEGVEAGDWSDWQCVP